MAGLRPQQGTVPPRGLPRNDPAFATERARRKLERRTQAKVRRRARGGAGNHFDPDDPEFESLIHAYAAHTGEDPNKVLDEELAAHGRTRRKGAGSINYLSEPSSSSSTPSSPAPSSTPAAAPAASAGDGLSVGDASGFMLGFLLWGWIVLPWVTAADGVSGPDAVRNVWRAKWLNKGPGGDRLLGGRVGFATSGSAPGGGRISSSAGGWQA